MVKPWLDKPNVHFSRQCDDLCILFTLTGFLYGMEDPQVVIEHDCPEAEPIVIFNMTEDSETNV